MGVRADCLFESFPCTVVPVIHFATVFESQRVDQAKHISIVIFRIYAEIVDTFLSAYFFRLQHKLFCHALPFHLVGNGQAVDDDIRQIVRPFAFYIFIDRFTIE